MEEIRPCLRCNEKCIMNVLVGKELTCSVNPQCGRESRFKLVKADAPRRVTVVGGGPAGMEAAVIAAQRGHKVTLLEEKDKLGGQLDYADQESFKWSISDFSKYLKRQVGMTGVDVKLNTRADVDVIRSTAPDAVVVATGADVFIPEAFAHPGVLTGTDKEGKTVSFPFDKVIAATGTRRINEIGDAVEKAFPETYIIGDCVKIGEIADSIHKGYITATQI